MTKEEAIKRASTFLQKVFHDGEWCPWLNKLIEERYGFKPYKL